MRNLKKTRRIQMIAVAAVSLTLSVVLIGYAMRDGINYFRSPSQYVASPVAQGEVFRLGGLVEVGTLVRGEGRTVLFSVTDGGASLPVTFTGVPPDLFKEGEGVVATGAMQGDIFVASEILAKHDESYMPKEVVDALKEQGTYKEPKP